MNSVSVISDVLSNFRENFNLIDKNLKSQCRRNALVLTFFFVRCASISISPKIDLSCSLVRYVILCQMFLYKVGSLRQCCLSAFEIK